MEPNHPDILSDRQRATILPLSGGAEERQHGLVHQRKSLLLPDKMP